MSTEFATTTPTLGYSVLDEAAKTVHDVVTTVPQYWLIIAAVLLVALFIVGLVKKMVIMTILVAIVVIGFCGLWIYSGRILPQFS